MFDQSIIKGVYYAIELLEEGQEEMKNFCDQINSFLETIPDESNWSSMKIYKLLQNAYEESSNLTSAAMIFGSVTKTSSMLTDSISKTGSILKELINLNSTNSSVDSLYKKTISILGNEERLPQKIKQNSIKKVEELNWLLDEMLGENISEEIRFVEELNKEVTMNCTMCESEGELEGEIYGPFDEDKDTIIIDADGVHRLQ